MVLVSPFLLCLCGGDDEVFYSELTCIANASQAANNLVNAITLVNAETDSLQANERVQECLGKAKLCRKPIVRYTQLVENEELIGTLIDTNERIIAALEMYDKVLFLILQ